MFYLYFPLFLIVTALLGFPKGMDVEGPARILRIIFSTYFSPLFCKWFCIFDQEKKA